MKSVFLLSVLLSSVSMADTACDAVSRQRYVDGWDEVMGVQRISMRITSGSKVYCEYYPDREQQLNLLAARERGHVDGVEYVIHYSDGSAVVQGQGGKGLEEADYTDNWHLSCRSFDPAGQVLCTIKKDDVVIERSADGKMQLTIGSDHLESSDILVRVKGQWAATASAAEGFTAVESDRIVLQMRAGESLDSRYHKRGKQRPTDRKTSLYGFNQMLLLMEKVALQLNVWKADEVQLQSE